MEIKLQLSTLRLNKNVSQKDIAEIVGREQTTISNWEKGLRYPRLDDIEKLCAYFEITPNQLLGVDELECYDAEKNEKLEHDNEILKAKCGELLVSKLLGEI